MRRTSFWIAAATCVLAATGARAQSGAVNVAAAAHHGEVDGDRVVWTSSIVVFANARSRLPRELRLATPLPDGVRLRESPGVAAFGRADGRLDRLEVRPARWKSQPGNAWHLVLEFEGPFDRTADGVTVPLVQTDAVQRVTIAARSGEVFEPDPDSGLEQRIGWWAAPKVVPRMKRAAERRLKWVEDRGGPPVYLVARSERPQLRGKLAPRRKDRRGVLAATVGGFCALLVLLGFGYRQLGLHAEAVGTGRDARGSMGP